jgi:hypothetical protein
MNDIEKIKFEVWTDGRREVSAFQFYRSENAIGLRRTWFVLTRPELYNLAHGKANTIQDGFHYLSLVSPDITTFYDFMLPNKEAGILEVPYFTINLPRVFWKFLFKFSCRAWKASHLAEAEALVNKEYWYGKRLEIEIPLSLLKRFTDRYGQGLGEVEKRFSPELLQELAEPTFISTNKDGCSLQECVDRVINIAKNYTRSIYGKCMISISGKAGDYYFSTYDAKGRRGLNGGIIWHRDHYSIHT